MDTDELPEILKSLDKMEIIVNVLNQTMIGDDSFNKADTQNLCSVLVREINYTKSKLSNSLVDKNFSC